MSKNKGSRSTAQGQKTLNQRAKGAPQQQTPADTSNNGQQPSPPPTQPAEVAKAQARAEAQAKAEAAEARTRPTTKPEPRQARAASVSEMPRSAPAASRASSDPRAWLISQLQTTLEQGKSEVAGIRRRLQVTYWSMIVLTAGLFVLGAALIGFPAMAYYGETIEEVPFGALAGSGAVIIGLLLYFRPLEQLQTMLADATYVSLIKDSFQYQVTLRLLALDLDDATTVAEAASHVGEAAQASMDLVYTQLQARRAAGG